MSAGPVTEGAAEGSAAAAPGAVVLRPLRWWDLERVLPLERELFGSGAWSAEVFWSELARHESRCYLLATDPASGVVLGYGGVMWVGAEADVQTLAVAPAAQGRGLGGRLLRALAAAARSAGATGLLLEVRADNRSALALYRRHGFEQLAVRRGYYQPEGVDAVVMRLRPIPEPAPDSLPG